MNRLGANATAFSSKDVSDTMAVCPTIPTSRNCPISVVTGLNITALTGHGEHCCSRM